MVRHRLSDQEVAHVIEILLGGASQSDVARHFRVNRSVIHRTFRRFQETGQYSVLPRSGRPRVTTQTDDRFLVLSARRQRFVTARTLQNDLQAAAGSRVSTQTIRNRLHQAPSCKNTRHSDPSQSPAASRSSELGKTTRKMNCKSVALHCVQ